ncbi:MAG: solute:sodium symporter family transporter [Kiritimatiellae bacterium]|jgi:SSS family solute:Na+ symporter|nr:solute:sodium symporter family transporter [Kiritimatiellia bacterium]
MEAITLISFFTVTGLVGLITWLITRRSDLSTNDGYFLGGRSLTFPFIAGTLLLTNLSTEQLVGLNGSAYTDGLSVMAWEVVAVIALVLMALFFLPKFLKSGITTLPQYLEIRFNSTTAAITNFIFLIAYAVILLPIILYTGAVGLGMMMNIGVITGIEDPKINLWILVWGVGIVGAIYALFGGLKTVAVSDTLNGIGLLIGGFMILFFGLNAVSGGEGVLKGFSILHKTDPQMFNSIGARNESVPFGTLFTGVMIINIFYWCTNQQIIQRTFGASSLKEGQKGVLLTGALKLFGPLYLVLPGIIAFYLFADEPNMKADFAYGTLVARVLPPYLTGFFAAAMVGAILSSFNSALNSTCTLFSIGVYKKMIKKNATEQQVVNSGKIFGWIMAFITMSIAPFLIGQESIFSYLQKMNGIYFIPIFAIVLTGMLTKRIPAIAATTALVTGIIVIAIGYFLPPFNNIAGKINEYHFLGIVFVCLILLMMLIGKIKPREEAFIQKDVKAVDMTPWKHAKLVGIILLLIVFAIYISFADFSVLN